MLDGWFMKETGISFPFLEPLNYGFLIPEYFLLLFSLDKFMDQYFFLLPYICHETSMHAFDLYLFDFSIQLCFSLKDVMKWFFVPIRDFLFKDFKILLELVHPRSPNGWYFLPPLF